MMLKCTRIQGNERPKDTELRFKEWVALPVKDCEESKAGGGEEGREGDSRWSPP